MNLNNALALNAKKITINTGETNRKVSHFQLTVNEEKNETNIVFSDSFMKLADVQNNKLNVYFENADECVYFIFHQGNGVAGESLAIDFFKGKKVSLKDADGNKIESDEIGIKTPRFKDAKTVSGETLRELITLQYPITRTVSQLKGDFEKHEEDFNMDLKVTSVWKFKSITHPSFNTPVANGVPSSFTTINNEVKQTPITVVPDIIVENKEDFFEGIFGEKQEVFHQQNTTATAINNFENSSYTDRLTNELLEETLTFVD
jgi:hypothetical protein